jgi:ubiquinone biosynthesis protein UbiJ
MWDMDRPPFISALADQFDAAARKLRPPQWLTDELQHRLVLFFNHVLMQEPEAQARLARAQGRVLRIEWGAFWLQLVATPAGLWDLAPVAEHDLLLTVATKSPFGLVRGLARGERPAVRIEGDADFASAVNWLIDHVRWDAEEDLARMIGDVPAHTLAEVGRGAVDALRRFAGRDAAHDKARS